MAPGLIGRSGSMLETEVIEVFRDRGWLRVVTTGLIAVPLTAWTFWGAAELYWEGWGLPFPQPLYYLAPMAVLWALGMAAVTWPRVGGWVLIVIGGLLAVWVISLQVNRGVELTVATVAVWAALVGSPVLAGVAFLFEAGRRSRTDPPTSLLGRHGDKIVLSALPALVVAAVSAYWLPIVVTRHDDGNRDAVVIETAEADLLWVVGPRPAPHLSVDG